MRLRRIGPFALCAVALVGRPAGDVLAAGTPPEIPRGLLLPGERVRGTFPVTGGTMIAGFAGIAGTRFSVSVRALAGSRVRPRLTVSDPDGAADGHGGKASSATTRASVQGLRVGATGVWRLAVTTSSGSGGAFELVTSGRPKSLATGRGVLGAEDPSGEFEFDVLPGSRLRSLRVSVAGPGAAAPDLQLVAPDGAVLATATARGRRAKLPAAVLPAFGTYRLRLSGGSGTYSVAAAISPPRARARTWQDAEALPDIRGVTPGAANNDGFVNFRLDGVGFSPDHVFRIVRDGATRFATSFETITQSYAIATPNLPSLPPGEYQLQVGTLAANSVTFPDPVVIRNRPPTATALLPSVLPGGGAWPVQIDGAGFDEGVVAILRRQADGAPVPISIESRNTSESLYVTISPQDYTVGPCDLELVDPDGTRAVRAAAVDVLGRRAAPAVVLTATGDSVDTTVAPSEAAYDPVGNRVCIAVAGPPSAAWVLADAETGTVLDTLVVQPPTAGDALVSPGVAWSPAERQWALTWARQSAAGQAAHVRIVDASDLHITQASHELTTGAEVLRVRAASDPVLGGWLVLYDRRNAAGAPRELLARELPPGDPESAEPAAPVAADSKGAAFDESIGPFRKGQFVAVFTGTTASGSHPAVRREILGVQGDSVYGPTVVASDATWSAVERPVLALNPQDGSVFVCFTTLSQAVHRPAWLRIDGETTYPSDVWTTDEDGRPAAGRVAGVAWSAARREFVVALSDDEGRVVLRRIRPKGPTLTMLAVTHALEFEGTTGLLWAGPSAESLGMAHAFDGVADGVHGGQGRMTIVAAPIR